MDSTEQEIREILKEWPDVSVNRIGSLWHIRNGVHSGSRSDGPALAREMMGRTRKRAPVDTPKPVVTPDAAPEPIVITKEVDRPETIERLTNLERAIEDEKRKREDAESKLAEAQDVPQEEESDFKFKVPFLQSERLVAEDLAQADMRLIKEYESLELRRPLDPVPDARWRLLRSNLFEFVG